MNGKAFAFWRGWLLVACAIFILQSLGWAAFGTFDPINLWSGQMAAALYDGDEPAEVATFRRFVLGPFGATVAGFFVLVFGLVYFAFPRREAWAYWTVVAAVLTWFLVDSAASIAHGAWFNVWIVNVPCLTALAIPLIGLFHAFGSGQGPA